MEQIVHPVTQALRAYRWDGDLERAPSWVRQCCFARGDVLIHERASGRQQVYLGEYLVRDMDGKTCFYTAEEFAEEFRADFA